MGKVREKTEKIGDLIILDIYVFSDMVTLIGIIENGIFPKAGMFLELDKTFYKINGIGHRKNLLNSPYKDMFIKKNIWELIIKSPSNLLKGVQKGDTGSLYGW